MTDNALKPGFGTSPEPFLSLFFLELHAGLRNPPAVGEGTRIGPNNVLHNKSHVYLSVYHNVYLEEPEATDVVDLSWKCQ